MLNSNVSKLLTLGLLVASVGLQTVTASAQNRGGRGGWDGRGGQNDRDYDRGDRGDRGGRGDYDHDDNDSGQGFDQYKAAELTDLLYRGLLFRNPDPAGRRLHIRHIAQGEYAFFEAGYKMAEDTEFQQSLRTRSAEQIVNNMYRVFFGSRPDRQTLRQLSRMIERGRAGEAVESVLQSDEFREQYLN